MERDVVVSNTTPLIALAWIEQLDLLPMLFGVVYIPQAVHRELHRNPDKIGIAELMVASWLRVQGNVAVGAMRALRPLSV